MPLRWNPREHLRLGAYVVKWVAIAAPTGAVIGSAVALFLWLLDQATSARWATGGPRGLPWLLYLLPVGGVLVGLLYHLLGKTVEGGNNLIIEQIHEPGGGVPARMAPLVLIGTLLTHLFGGSAGREGTAVQMGGSLAGEIGRRLGLGRNDTRTLLMAGVAAGFGAVFGTPLTGAIFAAEVLSIGVIRFQAIIPCLIASIVGDGATTAWGIRHTAYTIGVIHPPVRSGDPPGMLNAALLGKIAIASIGFGLASVLFAELTHTVSALAKRAIRRPVLRPAAGGLVVIALALLIGPDYLGLGVRADPNHPGQVSILSCFQPGGATALSWGWKILFTAVTVGSGFKGGEVTPLFFVGAALGNAMSRLLGVPPEQTGLFAAAGFVAVFAGATNTPLACTIMGLELFAGNQPDAMNGGLVIYLAVACFVAYLFSGHSGIYLSQRITHGKPVNDMLSTNSSLRTLRDKRRSFFRKS